jgi:hypothetical protein
MENADSAANKTAALVKPKKNRPVTVRQRCIDFNMSTTKKPKLLFATICLMAFVIFLHFITFFLMIYYKVSAFFSYRADD